MSHHLNTKRNKSSGRNLILASGSPRRRSLIKAIDLQVRILGSGDNEPSPYKGECPQDYVQRLALLKAKHTLKKTTNGIFLGADTVVVLDGNILGKPKDAVHAVQMLENLRGRSHEVLTGTALVDSATGVCATSVKVSEVCMRNYSDAEIAAYVASGEPFDKAGAYAAQDETFKPADRIDGCLLNVIGLPVCDVLTLLERIGAPAAFRQGWVIPAGCPDCTRWAYRSEATQKVNRA